MNQRPKKITQTTNHLAHAVSIFHGPSCSELRRKGWTEERRVEVLSLPASTPNGLVMPMLMSLPMAMAFRASSQEDGWYQNRMEQDKTRIDRARERNRGSAIPFVFSPVSDS